jgi:hypothetical protein
MKMAFQRLRAKIGNEAECAHGAPSGCDRDSGSRKGTHRSTLSAALKVAYACH